MAVDNVKLPLITDPADTFQREVRNALLLLERRLKTVEGDVTDLEAAPTAGEANTASNLGAGSGVYASKVGVDLRFKSIVAGTGMTVTPGTDDITLAATGSGEANTASNVGAGSQVFKAKTGVDLAFRSVVGSANVTVTQNADDITLTAAAPGETNTASNLGAGSGLYASKSGVDLRFKSLVAGSNVTLTAGANDVTIASTFTGFGSLFLGNGEDGALVFDGVATVLGVAPAAGANPYVGSTTYTLTRDIFATGVTISSGVVVVGGGHRIWCTGDIAGPGKIARNGGNGTTATTNAGGAGGGGTGSANTLGGSGIGGNGGGGGSPAAGGAAGGASGTGPYGYASGSTGTTPAGPTAGGTGGVGQGGAGGSGASAAGGTSGTITLANTTNGNYVGVIPQCFTGRTGANTPFTGGSGGGGGAGGTAISGGTTGAGGGGGGGGGAGPLVVAARSFSGGIVIEAEGGGGGNGAAATGAGVAGGGGGGAGGGGSWATVCYAEGTAPTVSVAGGTGGTGGTGVGGAPTGGNGGNGGAGLAYIFNLGA